MEAFLGELSLILIAIILRLNRDINADNAYILNIQLYVFWSTIYLMIQKLEIILTEILWKQQTRLIFGT